MCWYEQFPNVTWFSGSDQSLPAIGLTCRRVELHPGDTDYSGFVRLFNLLRKLPFLP